MLVPNDCVCGCCFCCRSGLLLSQKGEKLSNMEREREMFEERKHCTLCVHCRVVIWQAYIHTWLASIMGIVSSSLRARLQNFQSHALMGKLLSALAKLLPFPTKTLESLKNHLIRQELRRRQQPQRLSWLDPGMLSLTKTAITG